MELDDFSKMLNFATGTVDEKEINKIEINKLKHFPNHKFKLYTGERLENMVQSLKDYGVIVPIIVWENEYDFIILSGHNRVEACKIAGIDEIPCVIKNDLTLDEATLIVTETNLMQRSFSDLSHSERAYTLEQHYKTLKCQGRRTDLLQEIGNLMKENIFVNSNHNKAIKKVGDSYNLSKDTVARYMRLAKLIPSLLEKIDNEILPIRAGYNLSFIDNEDIQNEINIFIDNGVKIPIEKSEKLKNLFKEDRLNLDNLESYLLNENKYKRTRAKYKKIPNTVIDKYFNSTSDDKEIAYIIDKALEMYFNDKNIDVG